MKTNKLSCTILETFNSSNTVQYEQAINSKKITFKIVLPYYVK